MADSKTSGFGRGMPEGGIMPARSLRTTFSQVSGSFSTCAVSRLIEREAQAPDSTPRAFAAWL